MSMRATGVIEWLRGDGRYRLLDGFDPAMTYPQRLEIRRQALMSDLFITGVNAVTAEGTLHWLDKVGNRIAPVAFGPRKVIIVAGRNKIVANRDEAEERIRTIAAPQNIARHPGFRTPCAKTGVCSDCNSPDRVCNTRMEMLRCWPDKRVLVVDGEPVPYCLARIPQGGETRGNLAAGGRGEARPLTESDWEIARRVGPTLKAKGLIFVGLDIIGDRLTEINVTSPTCVREIEAAFPDISITGMLMDAIERRITK